MIARFCWTEYSVSSVPQEREKEKGKRCETLKYLQNDGGSYDAKSERQRKPGWGGGGD